MSVHGQNKDSSAEREQNGQSKAEKEISGNSLVLSQLKSSLVFSV